MNPAAKRAPRCTPAFGRCPDCRTPLQLWKFQVRGDDHGGSGATVDVRSFHELGCPECQAVKIQRHHVSCLCWDCAAAVALDHKI